jgi:hypothetical protein
MAEPRVLLSVVLGLVPANLLGYLGIAFRRRPVEGGARRALHRFSAWWLAIAVSGFVYAIFAVLVGLGYTPLPLVLVGVYTLATVNVVMFWGLLSYLLFLLMGKEKVFPWLTVVFLVQYVFYIGVVVWHQPNGVVLNDLAPSVTFARDPAAIVELVVALIFFLPPLLTIGLYATLFARVRQRTLRYRIGIVSASIFIMLFSSLVVDAMPAPAEWARYGMRVVVIASALAIFLAYWPPAWVQRVLRLEHLPPGVEAVPVFAPPADLKHKQEELVRRASDLV